MVASSGVTAYPAQFELLAIACPRLSSSIALFVAVRPLDAAALWVAVAAKHTQMSTASGASTRMNRALPWLRYCRVVIVEALRAPESLSWEAAPIRPRG